MNTYISKLGTPERMTEAEWLDVTWKRLAEEGDDTALSLDAKLQEAARTLEETLAELRDYARQKLTGGLENPWCPDNRCSKIYYHEHVDATKPRDEKCGEEYNPGKWPYTAKCDEPKGNCKKHSAL